MKKISGKCWNNSWVPHKTKDFNNLSVAFSGKKKRTRSCHRLSKKDKNTKEIKLYISIAIKKSNLSYRRIAFSIKYWIEIEAKVDY